jgi:aspartyl-tRNA synthetase
MQSPSVYRTHYAEQVIENLVHDNTKVKLSGWVAHVRKMGGLYFFVLRDNTDKIQIVAGNHVAS